MRDRSVMAFLAIAAIIFIVATVIATLDPFNTGQIWRNAITLGMVGIAGAFWALLVVVADYHESDKDYFSSLGSAAISVTVIGAIIVVLSTETVEPSSAALAWSAYAIGVISLLLSGATYYLVDDITNTREDSRSLTSVSKIS